MKILSATNRSLVGKEGTIVDETKNTLVVRPIYGKSVRIPKNTVRLQIDYTKNTGDMLIEGKTILGTPVERIRG